MMLIEIPLPVINDADGTPSLAFEMQEIDSDDFKDALDIMDRKKSKIGDDDENTAK